MPRSLLALTTAALCCAASLGRASDTNAPVDHSIGREPAYQSIPKYCLITIGDHVETKVWMVEDGQRLYIDKYANGDLTDDGPPLGPGNVRHLDATQWDFAYTLDAITPANGARHTDFMLRRWNYNYGATNDEYGLSFTVDGLLPMYAGWYGTFWSTNRAEAPVLHFGGPFTPKFLDRKFFTLGERGKGLTLGFYNPGSGYGAGTWLSTNAVPKSLNPKLTIDWPVAAGHQPLRTTHELIERCCYWHYYNTIFNLPDGVVPGEARVTVELPSGPVPLVLATNQIVIPVVPPVEASNSKP